MHELDRNVLAIARRQRLLFTRQQALEAGASTRQIDRRLADERWTRQRSGLYALPGHDHAWETKLLGACLVSGGVASHRSAAFLWGLDDFRRGRPEITVPRHQRNQFADIRVHESTQFDDRLGRTVKHGIAVTGIDRTLLDVGHLVGLSRLLVAIDEARRRRLTDWPPLFECLVRHAVRGRAGVATLRALLTEKYGEPVVPDSAFERMVERLLLDAGLEAPTLQHEVVDGAGRFVARVDLAYPRHLVGIELDGRHHIEDRAFQRDPVRRNRLTGLGWSMYHYTWRHYVDEPERLCAEIRAALQRTCVD
jgi:very-short-patch-repair endonuclease